jgi:hypothetical protein
VRASIFSTGSRSPGSRSRTRTSPRRAAVATRSRSRTTRPPTRSAAVAPAARTDAR